MDIPTGVRIQIINLMRDGVLIYQEQNQFVITDQASWGKDRETYFIIHAMDGRPGQYKIESVAHRGNHMHGDGKPVHRKRCGLYHEFYEDQVWTFDRGDIYPEGIRLFNTSYGGYLAGTVEPVHLYKPDYADQYWRIQVVEEVDHVELSFDQEEIEKQMKNVTPIAVDRFPCEYRGRSYVAHPKLSYTVTAENSFSNTVGISITSTAEFSAGIEGIASAKYSLSLEASFSMTWGKSVSYSHNIEQTLDVPITDKSVVAVLYLKRGKIKLPYTSTTYFKGGSVYKSSGIYKGVAYGDITAYVEDL